MSFREWETKKLINMTVKIGSGSTPRGGNSVYLNKGIPFIRSQNIYNCTFSKDGLAFINTEQAKKLNSVEIFEDDILLNITGDSVARCTIVPKEYIGGRVNQHVAIIRTDKEILDSNFLKYFLVSVDMQSWMLSLAQMGATRAALTKGMIESFEIPTPDLKVQKAIAHILSTLDEKIEVNNQINKTLEKMAQAIFKQWFVDFEFPNEDGEPYQSSGGEMVESEQGLVPKGWEVATLKDIINVRHGYAFKSEYFSDETTKTILLTPGNFKIGGGFKSTKFKYYKDETEIPKDYILHKDDMLITMTDLSKEGDTLGYPLIVPEMKNNKLLHNQRLGKVEMNENFNAKCFLYYLLCGRSYRHHILGSATGTTVKHSAPIRILGFKFIYPPKMILEKFEKLIENYSEISNAKINETSTLEELRDSLLPKLMSGEIRVTLNPDEEPQ